jgi:multidrug efflux pump subunit AcrB
LQLDGVESVSEWIGSGAPRFYLPLDQVFPQNNVSQFILVAKDLKAREEIRKQLPALMAEEFPRCGRAQAAAQRAARAISGAVPCHGRDPAKLRTYADEVKALMQANADMRGVNDNWNESIKVIRLRSTRTRRVLGVTSQSIAEATGMNFSGTTVGQFREGDKLIDIVMRPPKQDRDAITDIAGVYVTTANGQSIPLTQIAKPVMVWEPGVMWREKRNFAITVQGDVREGLQGATLTNELSPHCARWSRLACCWRHRLSHRGGRCRGGKLQGLGAIVAESRCCCS